MFLKCVFTVALVERLFTSNLLCIGFISVPTVCTVRAKNPETECKCAP